MDSSSIAPLYDLYIGHKDKEPDPTKLEDMSEEERFKLFELACTRTGLQLDPALFKKEAKTNKG